MLLLGGTRERRLAMAFHFHHQSAFRHGAFVRVDGWRQERYLERTLSARVTGGDTHQPLDMLPLSVSGTLFVDGIDEFSIHAQRILLDFGRRCADRNLEAPWTGRIIAGASVDLARAVTEGRFLASLHDDLDKVRITLGPGTSHSGDMIL